MQTQLIEHAGRYTESLAENGTDEHDNGTWNDASGVATTSQKRPHPLLVNPRSPQSMVSTHMYFPLTRLYTVNIFLISTE